MTSVEAMVIVKRKARYAFQPQFALVFLQADADAILAEHAHLEPVADTYGVFTDTTVYDTTSAAIACLEAISPFASTAKSLGGVSVSYEGIQLTINRLKSSQVSIINMGTAES